MASTCSIASVTPQLLVAIEQASRGAKPVEVRVDNLAPPDSALRDQPGPLEDRDVLLHGREAHRVVPRQVRDTLVAGDRPADDVAPRGVRQGAEHVVEVGWGDLH